MPITTPKHGVNNWVYAKQSAAAFRMLDAAQVCHEKTGKGSDGFAYRVAGRVRWCPQSGLWKHDDGREGQGVGSMLKYLEKLRKQKSNKQQEP